MDNNESILSKHRNKFPQTDPYLKTRVVATWNAKKEEKKKSALWRFLALGGAGAFCFLLAFGIFLSPSHGLKAEMGKAMIVKTDIKELHGPEAAGVVIQLPEGINFYSSKYGSISERKKMMINWEYVVKNNFELPVAIKGANSGSRTLKFLVINKDGEVLKTKSIKINFYKKS